MLANIGYYAGGCCLLCAAVHVYSGPNNNKKKKHNINHHRRNKTNVFNLPRNESVSPTNSVDHHARPAEDGSRRDGKSRAHSLATGAPVRQSFAPAQTLRLPGRVQRSQGSDGGAGHVRYQRHDHVEDSGPARGDIRHQATGIADQIRLHEKLVSVERGPVHQRYQTGGAASVTIGGSQANGAGGHCADAEDQRRRSAQGNAETGVAGASGAPAESLWRPAESQRHPTGVALLVGRRCARLRQMGSLLRPDGSDGELRSADAGRGPGAAQLPVGAPVGAQHAAVPLRPVPLRHSGLRRRRSGRNRELRGAVPSTGRYQCTERLLLR